MKLDKLKRYAPIAVRYGIGLVFLLFGISQLTNPGAWFSYFPDWLVQNSIEQTVLMNGIFDLIIGLLLLLGLFTRIAGAIGVLHLAGVIYVVGWSDIGIRDFGLLLGALSVFLYGQDDFCLDNLIFRKKR